MAHFASRFVSFLPEYLMLADLGRCFRIPMNCSQRPPQTRHGGLAQGFACLVWIVGLVMLSHSTALAEEPDLMRIGIIGLDTSHVPAFTKEFHREPASDPALKNFRVVAAYPHGSADIESSASRIPIYTAQVKELGVEVVDSIASMLEKVDCVLLETNDGRLHLDQAIEVFRAGKPVFIDKPTGSNLAEVVAIYQAAEQYGVPVFSSSSLRFSPGAQEVRNGKFGNVLGCDAYSPCSLEPTHVDLFWYGIHGVESLYTCMRSGCETVTHQSTPDSEFAVGVWSDGRIGTFRGIRVGSGGYGGTVFGDEGIGPIGPYGGYRPLVIEIAKFFRTHQPPVAAEETIELYAFMQAAAESKARGGVPVKVGEVIEKAKEQAAELLKGKLESK
jgi:predicted dehydrogenase